MDMIRLIEVSLGKKADIIMEEIQLGDVKNTYADISHANKTKLFSKDIDRQRDPSIC